MFNLGTDIVKISRMEEIISNEKTLKKIFTENELSYISSKSYNLETIAGLFASKEAALKSLQKGLDGLPLKEIEISHTGSIPYLTFHGNTKKEIDYENLDFKLSISHDGEYAIATVICFKR